MKKIYLVVGNTGEYSDWTTWVVAAYASKEEAEEHRRLAEGQAKEMGEARGSRFQTPEGKNPYDPGMEMDYTGTTYRVEEVSAFESVQEFLG